MNNIHQLYEEYQKIKKIIKSSYNIEDYDEDIQNWIKSNYKLINNGYTRVYIHTDIIRSICQQWLDKIVKTNNIDKYKYDWMDFIYFWIRGQSMERKRFKKMLLSIYYDMAQKLDDLDGGTDRENDRIQISGFGR